MLPLFTKVFVEPIVETQRTTSNLATPVTNLLKGKILFAGHECTEALKPGVNVLYEKGQGNPFVYNGVEGLFFEEKQLICVL